LRRNHGATWANLLCRMFTCLQMALIFVEILQPPTHASFGSLYLMCSPSEGVGCLIVLLAEADLTLNILLVIVVNLSALGLSSPFRVSLLHRSANQPLSILLISIKNAYGISQCWKGRKIDPVSRSGFGLLVITKSNRFVHGPPFIIYQSTSF